MSLKYQWSHRTSSGSNQLKPITEEEHRKLKMAVTKQKAILSDKRKVINAKHILTTLEILGGLNGTRDH